MTPPPPVRLASASKRNVAAPVSALQFGLLTTIEMATAVLVYIPVAYMADRSTKKPFVLMTIWISTIFWTY